VIVGGNTVRQDNPNLTSHGAGNRNPLRVVMSRQLSLPTDAKLWDVAVAPTLVMTQLGVDGAGADGAIAAALRQQGVEVAELASLTPDAVMANLYERGLMSVLWECGGTLAAAAIATGCVQKVWAFVTPKLIGGAAAPSPIGDLGLSQMSQAKILTQVKMTPVGEDFLIEGYLSGSL
jgi:diaminohydroxyphosphoribosylaminopyrimidine deaminase / 5-amino-6-(5-phosphoribosylamino)uracil reductase